MQYLSPVPPSRAGHVGCPSHPLALGAASSAAAAAGSLDRAIAAELFLDKPFPEKRTAVGALAKALVAQQQAGELARLSASLTQIENVMASLATTKSRLEGLLAGLDRFCRIPSPNEHATRWSVLSVAKVVVYGTLSLTMLAVGWNTISTILWSTGLFDSKWSCGLFSALPLAVPIVLETLGGLLSPAARRRYVIGLSVLAVVFGLAWCVLFALAFGSGLAVSPDQVIAQAVSGATPASSSAMGLALIMVGLFAEALVAAVSFLAIESTFRDHQLSTTIANPECVVIEHEIAAVMAKCESAASNRAELLGRRAQLEADQEAYIALAERRFENSWVAWQQGFAAFAAPLAPTTFPAAPPASSDIEPKAATPHVRSMHTSHPHLNGVAQ